MLRAEYPLNHFEPLRRRWSRQKLPRQNLIATKPHVRQNHRYTAKLHYKKTHLRQRQLPLYDKTSRNLSTTKTR